MDTTDPDISFDETGYCNHCETASNYIKIHVIPTEKKQAALENLVSKLKENGRGKKYDCVIGVSGGVDSTFVAYKIKQLGLRPLAIHLDNGWNSELAVSNIRKTLAKLDIELHTIVLDWEEFKSLQVAFLRSSTPDSEIPTDHAILAVLRKFAAEENVPIISGTNFASESILPKAWSQGYIDWPYIKKINRLFGTQKLKTFPHLSFFSLFYFNRIVRQRMFSLLDYIEFDKERAKQVLIDELGWRDYGGKHHESIYTKFFQSYILPVKFGFDKRRAHLSSLIISGQMKRDEALKEMLNPSFSPKEIQSDSEYVQKKLGLNEAEFKSIMSSPLKKYEDFSPLFWRKAIIFERNTFKKIIKVKNQFYKRKSLI